MKTRNDQTAQNIRWHARRVGPAALWLCSMLVPLIATNARAAQITFDLNQADAALTGTPRLTQPSPSPLREPARPISALWQTDRIRWRRFCSR